MFYGTHVAKTTDDITDICQFEIAEIAAMLPQSRGKSGKRLALNRRYWHPNAAAATNSNQDENSALTILNSSNFNKLHSEIEECEESSAINVIIRNINHSVCSWRSLRLGGSIALYFLPPVVGFSAATIPK